MESNTNPKAKPSTKIIDLIHDLDPIAISNAKNAKEFFNLPAVHAFKEYMDTISENASAEAIDAANEVKEEEKPSFISSRYRSFLYDKIAKQLVGTYRLHHEDYFLKFAFITNELANRYISAPETPSLVEKLLATREAFAAIYAGKKSNLSDEKLSNAAAFPTVNEKSTEDFIAGGDKFIKEETEFTKKTREEQIKHFKTRQLIISTNNRLHDDWTRRTSELKLDPALRGLNNKISIAEHLRDCVKPTENSIVAERQLAQFKTLLDQQIDSAQKNKRRNKWTDWLYNSASIVIPVIGIARAIYSRVRYNTWQFWKTNTEKQMISSTEATKHILPGNNKN